MTDLYPRIQRIIDNISAINNGQIAIEPTQDSQLEYRALGWKDSIGGVFKCLAKSQKAFISDCNISSMAGATDGIVRHDALGNLYGGLITIDGLNDLISDGPISTGQNLNDTYHFDSNKTIIADEGAINFTLPNGRSHNLFSLTNNNLSLYDTLNITRNTVPYDYKVDSRTIFITGSSDQTISSDKTLHILSSAASPSVSELFFDTELTKLEFTDVYSNGSYLQLEAQDTKLCNYMLSESREQRLTFTATTTALTSLNDLGGINSKCELSFNTSGTDAIMTILSGFIVFSDKLGRASNYSSGMYFSDSVDYWNAIRARNNNADASLLQAILLNVSTIYTGVNDGIRGDIELIKGANVTIEQSDNTFTFSSSGIVAGLTENAVLFGASDGSIDEDPLNFYYSGSEFAVKLSSLNSIASHILSADTSDNGSNASITLFAKYSGILPAASSIPLIELLTEGDLSSVSPTINLDAYNTNSTDNGASVINITARSYDEYLSSKTSKITLLSSCDQGSVSFSARIEPQYVTFNFNTNYDIFRIGCLSANTNTLLSIPDRDDELDIETKSLYVINSQSYGGASIWLRSFALGTDYNSNCVFESMSNYGNSTLTIKSNASYVSGGTKESLLKLESIASSDDNYAGKADIYLKAYITHDEGQETSLLLAATNHTITANARYFDLDNFTSFVSIRNASYGTVGNATYDSGLKKVTANFATGKPYQTVTITGAINILSLTPPQGCVPGGLILEITSDGADCSLGSITDIEWFDGSDLSQVLAETIYDGDKGFIFLTYNGTEFRGSYIGGA